MATPILNITEVADGQIDQFLVYNQALRDLEAATNAILPLDLSAANRSITSTEFTRNYIFVTTGNAVSRTLSFPSQIRNFVVRNAGSAVLIAAVGTTQINVPVGRSRMFYSDGTTNGLVLLDFTT
jgi:hypothetical protein